MKSPELDRLKQATAWMWALGDYASISPLLEPVAIKLADMCEIVPGLKVLDVAAGDGNFALAAVARGAVVTACDLTPRMIEMGRARTAGTHADIEWLQADVEDLALPEGSFDVVASVFGAMFAPQPLVVAAELFRVCREGGLVAMANYGWGGFLGAYARLMTRFSGPAPPDLQPPFDWGEADVVRQRFAGLASDLDLQPASLTMRFDSVDDFMEFWQSTNGPTIALKMILPADRYAEFAGEAARLARDMNESTSGGLQLSSAYLNVLARK